MSDKFFKFKQEIMDPISSSYCAAKWYNATIWLNHGKTVSCHHPASHDISKEEILKDPSAIHNTSYKKQMRVEMLQGQRPAECKYCWDIEDLLNKELLSDRVSKTNIYSNESIEQSKHNANENISLQTIEISFDSICNFACSYCSPTFSSTWQNLAKKFGPFKDISDKTVFQYQSPNGLWESEKFEKDNNPYVKAFWEWWPELSKSLFEIRLTGGEPLMSQDVWKLIDLMQSRSSDEKPIQLAINTNLGAKDEIIDKFVESARVLGKRLDVYTSCESFESSAEFTRFGFNWDKWNHNCEKMLSLPEMGKFIVMTTVNALSYESFPDFLLHFLHWREKFKHRNIYISINILKDPHFLGIPVLPRTIREQTENKINEIILNYRNGGTKIFDSEIIGLTRLIEYSKAKSNLLLEQDLKTFVTQYSHRTNQPLTMLPEKTVEWINSISSPKIIPIIQI